MTMYVPKMILHDGLDLPAIGFGTSKLIGSQGSHVIKDAIDVGYRLIDTAYNYENEGAVGEAVRRSALPRGDISITSKLPGRYQDYHQAVSTIQESLYRANLDYFDLYLIHWPNPIQDNYVEAWQALIEAKKWGLVRSIGVCNFLPEHIERLKKETGVQPSLNQIELHPLFNQNNQRNWHKENNIQTQSWSPLARANAIFEHEVLHEIANRHKKSVSQITLRWHYQLGTIPIPKSTSKKRQQENIDIFNFSLSDRELNKVNELTEIDGRIQNQDPAVYEEF